MRMDRLLALLLVVVSMAALVGTFAWAAPLTTYTNQGIAHYSFGGQAVDVPSNIVTSAKLASPKVTAAAAFPEGSSLPVSIAVDLADQPILFDLVSNGTIDQASIKVSGTTFTINAGGTANKVTLTLAALPAGTSAVVTVTYNMR